MRLLLDLQCVQSTSAVRGIGRYALSLTQALATTAGPDDAVEVLLNAGDDSVRLLRARTALETFLPPRAVHVFDAPWPWHHGMSEDRRRDAEAVRTAAIASLRPDVLLVASLFEGDTENVLSIEDGGVPTAALLYDLIPATDPGTYLLGPGAESYWRRFAEMGRADLLLAISQYSGQQAQDLLGPKCPPVVPVWGGPYPSGLFQAFEERAVPEPPAVPERYLLAVGGDHPRKNLDRLVEAWARVSTDSRAGTALVIACRLNVGTLRRLRRVARRAGLQPQDLVLTGEVSEVALDRLYRRALAFIFPSTEEGLGLPPLEAMAAGCPTVLASGSSLSELVQDPEAYFDGLDVADMARSMARVLDDSALRGRLRRVASASTARFTWTRSAELAWRALRELPRRPGALPPPPEAVGSVEDLRSRTAPLLLDEVPPVAPPGADVLAAERALGVRSPLPAGLRTALATAPALVASADVTRPLVQAGLVEQAVLTSSGQLQEAFAHDLYVALGPHARRSPHPVDLVRALAHPPRWSLERPWPVWLLLTEDDVDAATLCAAAGARGAVLAVARAGSAVLARSADHVMVAADVAQHVEANLRDARCHGARVTVIGTPPGLPWAGRAPDVLTALGTVPAERTTGWPWAVARGDRG